MVLVDIHSHLLPKVDDGSPSLNDSLELAKAAVNDGITHALLTPHHLNGVYINHKEDVVKMTSFFQAELKKHQIPLTVFPGQEVRLNSQIPQAIDEGDIITCDEDGRYLLLELPSEDVPAYTKRIIYEITGRGMVPIICHPERNRKILEDPKILEQLLEMGCLTQITASSYVGVFGKEIEKMSENLVNAGQVATFASDAHVLPKRESKMTAAYKKLAKKTNVETVNSFKMNARSIINGEEVNLDWRPIKKKRFWIF